MKVYSRRLVLPTALVVCGVCGVIVVPNDTAFSQATPVDQSERVTQASREVTLGGLRKAYQELFQGLKPEELARLKSHPHDGIALQAALEEIRRSASVKSDRASQSIDRNRLTWLAGFVEGRLRIGVPKWWQEVLVDAELRQAGELWFPSRTSSLLEGSVRIVSRTTSTEKARVLNVLVNDRPATLPEHVLSEHSHLVGAIAKDRVYVASHMSLCFPFHVYATDRVTGKILWEAEVAAAGKSRMYAGLPKFFHWVSIVLDNDRLLVFGAGVDVVYIEAFRTSDGSNLFRFGTRY